MSLKELIDEPFALLLEIESRAKEAIARDQGGSQVIEEWIGVAFRLGSEHFVTARADVREVLSLPDQITRIPGAKPWLRGIANVRGQLLTIADLRAFLGSGATPSDRRARILVLASRDVPTAVIVDEVQGFRRFGETGFSDAPPPTKLRCDQYLVGAFSRDDETYPQFDLGRLIEDPSFLDAGHMKQAG